MRTALLLVGSLLAFAVAQGMSLGVGAHLTRADFAHLDGEIALMKGGANPKNAKLFIDFVVSKECQTAMEAGVNTRPIRGDVPMTTEGRVKTEDIIQIAYPVVDSDEIKAHFQDIVTSF